MVQDTPRKRFLWLLNNTLNRVTTEIARSGRGPFSLIRHVGRKSGRSYETPVILAKVPEGFMAELTYGDSVNWYRNVVAAGGCVVVHHRVDYDVSAIESCSAGRGRSAYPAPFRLVLKARPRRVPPPAQRSRRTSGLAGPARPSGTRRSRVCVQRTRTRGPPPRESGASRTIAVTRASPARR